MKKKAIRISYIVAITIGVILLTGFFLHEKRPVVNPSPSADSIARVMVRAVNKAAWDTTRYVSWNFLKIHQYLWDKENDHVMIEWSDYRVLLHTKTVKGIAYQKDRQLSRDKADQMIRKAWAFFCNDSFWLNAPVKAFDPGTERSLVRLDDGRTALMVSYSSGGVTPGDAYAWLLDENGLPESWKMWVSIIPVGGIEVSWTDWITLNGGAKIATEHQKGPFSMQITALRGGAELSDFAMETSPFIPLEDIR